MNILYSKIYGESNDSTPIVIIHGLLGMSDNWGYFGRALGQKQLTHVVDLRNHGKSFHAEETSYKTLAKDILNYLDFHKIEKADFIGHSMGGKVAMQFSLDYPNRINKLVVVDIAPKRYKPHHDDLFNILNSINLNDFSSRSEIETELKKGVSSDSLVQFLLKNLFWKNERLAWKFNLEVLTKHYHDEIVGGISEGVFQGKTLFIAGEKSNYISKKDEDPIKNQFPNSEIVTIENTGHWVQADNPKRFLEIVENFLDSN